MADPILSNRQLNRATLARQMLLERSDAGIVEAVRFLGGLQAQQSNDPYIGLWSRLSGFSHEALTALIVDKTLARATTMRGTLHLHPVDDLVGFRALVAPFLKAAWKSNFLRRFGSEDQVAVHKAGVRLLNKQPMTAGELGKRLQEKFPAAEPLALAVLVQMSETLVQIPPTRLWGNGSAPLLSRLENWLPVLPKPSLTRIDLVRRYLAAYGPASVNDMQTWCRLTKLSVEFKALETELVRFESADGRVLYDLPDAPRLDADRPAPVRFLPDFDNVLLGYADRARIVGAEDQKRLVSLSRSFRCVLVDGFVTGSWAVSRSKQTAILALTPFRKLLKREIRDIESEGHALLGFMHGHAAKRDVVFAD